MPAYTVERLQDALNDMGLALKEQTVGILGLSYKAGVADLRESPAEHIIEAVKNHGAKVETFDPLLIDNSSAGSLAELLEKSDALILATNHREFIESLTPEMLIAHNVKAIVDGKNCLNKEAFTEHEQHFIFRGIGR
jgi:UDP-N-acetyl-D-mannosaminuronate dehydrogenase